CADSRGSQRHHSLDCRRRPAGGRGRASAECNARTRHQALCRYVALLRSGLMALDTQTLHGLDGVLEKLKSLPPEIVSKRGGPVKSALRKGAVVIQKEWVANLKAIIAEPNEGVPHDGSGLLVKNVVVTRDSRPRRSGANERYVVRVRNKRYPKASPGQKQAATTAQVAR